MTLSDNTARRKRHSDDARGWTSMFALLRILGTAKLILNDATINTLAAIKDRNCLLEGITPFSFYRFALFL
jgi:hypothetical protein